MFLKINTVKTNTRLSHGAHILSDAVSLLGSVASIVTHRSSQVERQFNKLQSLLRHLTRQSSVELRNDVFNYGEAHFWGKPAYVDLDPGIARIVDSYVAQAKAA